MTNPALDPAFLPLLEFFPGFDLSRDTLPEIRQHFAALMPPVAEDDDHVSLEYTSAPAHIGEHQIPLLIYRAKNRVANCPLVLEIHGGGYMLGTAAMGDAANRALATAIGGVVVAVDYRLAPETPFPGNVEDCYSALLWIFQNADDLGIDPQRIAVIGTSAGGGLAAALCLLARDRGVIPVAFQGLLMPMLDDRTVARFEANPNPHLGEFIWTHANNRFAWAALLNGEPGAENISCYAAPARATELAGLPSTYLSIGALDLFAEETLDYGKRLLAAGVPVDLHVYAGAPHAYNGMPDALASQQEAGLFLAALRRTLAVG